MHPGFCTKNVRLTFNADVPVFENAMIVVFFRIHTEKNGGAWCPKNPIAPGVYEWLEINLRVLKTITLIETQGRFGNGQVRAFV